MTNKAEASSRVYEIHPEHSVIHEQDGRSVEVRQPVWIKLNVEFRNELLRTLKGSPLSVFICVALHMIDKYQAWPTQITIANETGYSEPAVRVAIRKLEADGLLSVERHSFVPGVGKKPNLYTVEQMAAFGKGSNPYSKETFGQEANPKATDGQTTDGHAGIAKEEPIQQEPTEEEPSIYRKLLSKNVYPSIAKTLCNELTGLELETALAMDLTEGPLVEFIRGNYIEPVEANSSADRNGYCQGQFADFLGWVTFGVRTSAKRLNRTQRGIGGPTVA